MLPGLADLVGTMRGTMGNHPETSLIFWGVVQGAPTGSAGSKVVSVKVNGSATAISMAYCAGYNAGVAPATNDVAWGLVVGSDYLLVDKRA
jgi:hypothetical protein